MLTEKILQGDLLFHPVHGVCRVSKITKQNESKKEVVYYSLIPKLPSHMKARFVVATHDIPMSGFHCLVSLKEANDILEYLKKGHAVTNSSAPKQDSASAASSSASSIAEPENQTWALAKAILSCSIDKSEARDQRKRQMLDRSAKGLIAELAFVLEITAKEAVARVRRSLERTSKVNPLVLTALAHAIDN